MPKSTATLDAEIAAALRQREALEKLRALPRAVEDAGQGYYFEQGGCWGMALALEKMLRAAGFFPQLAVNENDFVHAWVFADGHMIDWEGPKPASQWMIPGKRVSRKDLYRAAARYGISESDVNDDRHTAEQILRRL